MAKETITTITGILERMTWTIPLAKNVDDITRQVHFFYHLSPLFISHRNRILNMIRIVKGTGRKDRAVKARIMTIGEGVLLGVSVVV